MAGRSLAPRSVWLGQHCPPALCSSIPYPGPLASPTGDCQPESQASSCCSGSSGDKGPTRDPLGPGPPPQCGVKGSILPQPSPQRSSGAHVHRFMTIRKVEWYDYREIVTSIGMAEGTNGGKQCCPEPRAQTPLTLLPGRQYLPSSCLLLSHRCLSFAKLTGVQLASESRKCNLSPVKR